jgi:hypothetical protein
MIIGLALGLSLSACNMGTMSDTQKLATMCTSGNAAIKTVIVAHDNKKMSDEEYANLKEPILKFQKVCGADYPMTQAELKVVGFDAIVALLREKAGL